MAKYADDEIRNMSKITLNFAVHNEERDCSKWSESWSYNSLICG